MPSVLNPLVLRGLGAPPRPLRSKNLPDHNRQKSDNPEKPGYLPGLGVGKFMTSMQDDRLYHDAALVQLYDLDNGWDADCDHIRSLTRPGNRVLDLGCGTGYLAAGLAESCDVTGVDPAVAMLQVARNRPGGDRVTWVEGDARRIRLGRSFDLVVMTGHAFQCLLSEADQRACCETIAAHLAPDGRFIFDSRNPAARAWESWTPARANWQVAHPEMGRVKAWNDHRFDEDTGIVTYETHYQAPDGRHFQAEARIRFTRREQIAARLAVAGLQVTRWMGDWQGNPMRVDSPEIIPLGKLAEREGRQQNPS